MGNLDFWFGIRREDKYNEKPRDGCFLLAPLCYKVHRNAVVVKHANAHKPFGPIGANKRVDISWLC